MSKLIGLELEARRMVVTRHYEGDGRWGRPDLKPYVYRGWIVVKARPEGAMWWKSTGINAKKVHAGKYQLIATHVLTQTVAKLTVWQCGGMCFSDLRRIENPDTVCAKCEFALHDRTIVKL